MGRLYDCYIAELWKKYRKLDNINLGCNVLNVENNVCPEIASTQPSAGRIHDSDCLFVSDNY